MRNRIIIAIIVFLAISLLSTVPIAIVLAILNIYLSGHGIIELGTFQMFPGMDAAYLLFTIAVIFSGLVGSALYWRISKPPENLS
jgi:hypothetical protein